MALTRLYHNRSYNCLLVSNIINRCGDSLDTVLFMWLVYTVTGSAGWSAVIFGFNQAASVIAQPFIGPLVERFPKKRVLLISDVFRACLVLCITAAYFAGALGPWMLALATVLVSLTEAFHMPAGVAVIQNVLDKQYYDKGVGNNVSYTKIAVLAGTGFAGVVISGFGIGVSLILDCVIFLISATLITQIKLKNAGEENEKKARQTGEEKYFKMLGSGFRYITGNKRLLRLCLLCILVNSAVVPFDALLAPMSAQMFRGGMRRWYPC